MSAWCSFAMFCPKLRNMVIRIIIPCVQTPLFPTEKIGERDIFLGGGGGGEIGGNKGDYMETIMNNLPQLPFRLLMVLLLRTFKDNDHIQRSHSPSRHENFKSNSTGISIIFKVIHHIQHEHSRHSHSTHRKLIKFNKKLDHIQSHALYSTNTFNFIIWKPTITFLKYLDHI